MNNPLGVSSACLYPKLTEEALEYLAKMNIPTVELFINSFCEMEPEYIRQLKRLLDTYQMKAVSVHPFLSFAESFFLFGNYQRRFRDIIPTYQRFFELTAELGADIFVIHGFKNVPKSEQKTTVISDEEHFERFARLTELGKSSGIHVCQENVVKYKAQSPEYLQAMANYIGNDFGIVLDIKQAVRSKVSPFTFIEQLSPYIRHVHLSDHNSQTDCMAPGSGTFDFKAFFTQLDKKGYSGSYIIELYEYSYKNMDELYRSYQNMSELLSRI